MTVGDRIKYYRELKGYTQSEFSHLTGISLNTLRKYENNTRNPKLGQLSKISDILNISIHALEKIELNTLSDIIPYLLAIGKIGDIQFNGEKDSDGNYIENNLSFTFKSPILKHYIKEWADKKEVIDKLRSDALNTPDEQAKEFLLKRADEIEKEIELRMVDSKLIVTSENNKN